MLEILATLLQVLSLLAQGHVVQAWHVLQSWQQASIFSRQARGALPHDP